MGLSHRIPSNRTLIMILSCLAALLFSLSPILHSIITPTNISNTYIDNVISENRNRANSGILITEIFPDTLRPESGGFIPDEFLIISNIGESPVFVGGWYVSDGEGEIFFPSGASIPPGDSITITANGSAFFSDIGKRADYEWHDLDPSTPDMSLTGNLWLANTAEELTLKTDAGVEIDTVIWGDTTESLAGWIGDPVPQPSEGEVLRRNRDVNSRIPADTNKRDDWMHFRKYWLGYSEIDMRNFVASGPVIPFVSPDSSFSLISNEIDSASISIMIEIYQFTNWYIAQRLFAALDRGVSVQLLLEGGPVGWHMETWGEQNPDVNQEKYIVRELSLRGADVRFMKVDRDNFTNDRYPYIHAKYAIFDTLRTVVMTENWKESGVPSNPTNGNRGWGVLVEDEALAQYMTNVFENDFSNINPDIISYTPDHEKYGDPSDGFVLNESTAAGNYRPHFDFIEVSGSINVTPVISPDTSLRYNSGIIKMLDDAEENILAQLFYFDRQWDQNGLTGKNPYVESLLDAARRGVTVRVTLDSSDYDQNGVVDNKPSCAYLNDLAVAEELDLVCRIFDPAMTNLIKLHNKGLIVDDSKVLVSSINWNLNSITNNREVGLIIESKEIAYYFTDVFMSDWENNDPVAVPGDDLLISPGDTAELNGSGSWDPDGDPLSYAWKNPDNTVESGPVIQKKFHEAGTYQVELTVLDGRGGEDAETVTVTVNTAPVALISVNDSIVIEVGEFLLLDGDGSYDADGDPLTYWWSFGDGSNFGYKSGMNYSYGETGIYEILLRVSDGIEEDTDSVTVTVVSPGNYPPVITIISPIEGSEYSENATINFEASANDPDGDVLSFAWESNISGILGNEISLEISIVPGYHRITLQVDDGYGHKISAERTIAVKRADENATQTNGSNEKKSIPAVIITSPGEGEKVKGIVSIEGVIQGGFRGDRDVLNYKIDNDDWMPVSGAGKNWNFNWDSTSYENRLYTISLRVRVLGIWSENASVTVTVTNPPGDRDDEKIKGDGDPEEDLPLEIWIAFFIIGALILIVALLIIILRRKKIPGPPKSDETIGNKND